MSRRPWLSFGFFVPMLAALLLVIAVSCGGGATSTAAPQPEAVAPAAEPAAEPEAAAEETTGADEVAPTATPVPVAAATAAAVAEVGTTAAEPFGTLNIGESSLGRYTGHSRYAVSGSGKQLAGSTTHEAPFQMDVNAQFQGLMVDEWSIAPDNRVWTFKLHKGIQFHGGWGEVTPEDIIYSTREFGAIDGHCGCIQTQAIFDNADGYWVGLDNYTLELDTGVPAWDVLNWLHQPSCCASQIFSKKQWDSLLETQTVDEAIHNLVGTGPFELTEDRTGEFWAFKAVRDHWRKTPEFAEVKFLDIPEEATRLANFLTGKIDTWLAFQDSVPVAAEDPDTKFMSQKGVRSLLLIIWQNGYTYHGTDQERGGYKPELPWISSDPDLDSEGWERARKVREAMGLAIDREKIVDELLGGEGEAGAVYGWQPHKSRWPEGFEWEYDLDRAKQLMKEAGYEDGFDIDIAPTNPALALACEAIADMLGDININAKYNDEPSSVFYPRYKDRTQQGLNCQNIPAFGSDPIQLHRFSYDPTATWGLGWDHPWYTEILLRAYETFDRDERWALQVEMGQWMRDNALGMDIYGGNAVYPLGPKIDSWEEHLSMGGPTRISGLEYAIHRK